MDKFDYLLAILVVTYTIICPYAKVEESFNLQATHDLLIHQTDLEKYDHHEFPGVVPRTFIGPFVLALFSYPFVSLIQLFQLPKFYFQYVVRICLGLLLTFAFVKFRSQVSEVFGKDISKYFLLITISQFHLLFYMSRTLPNSFALFLVMLGFTYWLKKDYKSTIFYFTLTITIFRSEVVLLFGPLMLEALIRSEIKFLRMVLLGIVSFFVALAISVGVDSVFWETGMWAEGVVFWYNAILGKSVNWGVSPFHWYFTRAIPKALMFALFFIPFAFDKINYKRAIRLLLPILCFVIIYSKLPHKELRFIFYALPILNLVAAMGLSNVIVWSQKRQIYSFLAKLFFILLLANFFATCSLLYMSAHNYPGGYAFHQLHQLEKSSANEKLQIHIDVAAAQQGVSRFGELYPAWVYSKEEDLTDFSRFDYLLSEKDKIAGFQVIDTIYAFGGLKREFPFVTFKPGIYIHQKNFRTQKN